jgi:hypothetical protein
LHVLSWLSLNVYLFSISVTKVNSCMKMTEIREKSGKKNVRKYFWIQISFYNIEHMVVKFILLHKSSIFTSSWISLRRNSLFLLNIANYRNLIMIVDLLFSHQFFKNKKSYNFFHPISKIYYFFIFFHKFLLSHVYLHKHMYMFMNEVLFLFISIVMWRLYFKCKYDVFYLLWEATMTVIQTYISSVFLHIIFVSNVC